MDTADDIRLANLAALIAEHGSQRALADAIDKAPAQISQWINSAPQSRTGKPRVIHRDTAREIEQRLGLPPGWMDHDHTTAPARGAAGPALSPDERAILDLYHGMTPDRRAAWAAAGRAFAQPLKRGTKTGTKA